MFGFKKKTCHLTQKEDSKNPAGGIPKMSRYIPKNKLSTKPPEIKNNKTNKLTVNYLDLSGHHVSNYIAAVAIHSHINKYSTTHAHLSIKNFLALFFYLSTAAMSLALALGLSTVTCFV